MAPSMQALYIKTLSPGTSVSASCCLRVGGQPCILVALAECGIDIWTGSDGALTRGSTHPLLGRVAAMVACGDEHVLIATEDNEDRCGIATARDVLGRLGNHWGHEPGSRAGPAALKNCALQVRVLPSRLPASI